MKIMNKSLLYFMLLVGIVSWSVPNVRGMNENQQQKRQEIDDFLRSEKKDYQKNVQEIKITLTDLKPYEKKAIKKAFEGQDFPQTIQIISDLLSDYKTSSLTKKAIFENLNLTEKKNDNIRTDFEIIKSNFSNKRLTNEEYHTKLFNILPEKTQITIILSVLTDTEKDAILKAKTQATKIQTITIMMVGKTRAGKTTAIRTLLNPTYIPPQLSIFSSTKSPCLKDFFFKTKIYLKNKEYKKHQDDQFYHLKLIDTPGLGDTNSIIGKQKTLVDKQIFDDISSFLQHHNIRFLDRIFFTFSKTAGLQEGDVRSIKSFINVLSSVKLDNQKDIPRNFCLLCTRSEDQTTANKQDTAKELLHETRMGMATIMKFCQNYLFFIGCIKPDDYDNLFIDTIKYDYKKILTMSQTLLFGNILVTETINGEKIPPFSLDYFFKQTAPFKLTQVEQQAPGSTESQKPEPQSAMPAKKEQEKSALSTLQTLLSQLKMKLTQLLRTINLLQQ